jgi:hypothetical protein
MSMTNERTPICPMCEEQPRARGEMTCRWESCEQEFDDLPRNDQKALESTVLCECGFSVSMHNAHRLACNGSFSR